jgi:hypothetical protein
VRKVDLAVELQILGYYEHSRRPESAGVTALAAAKISPAAARAF